jgi:hypothetical protein
VDDGLAVSRQSTPHIFVLGRAILKLFRHRYRRFGRGWFVFCHINVPKGLL